MKLSTILSNYGEFQTSYKKIGYSQDKINIKNKTEVRLLLDKVISDIVIFNDLLNLYDYSQSEKNQILRALNKLGLKRETFMQILVQKNYDNYIEDASILQDDYSDMQLFEASTPSKKEIELIEDVEGYFNDSNIKLTSKFNLKKFAKSEGLKMEQLVVLLCNLENIKLMKQIAKGDYSDFDFWNKSDFNDDYEDMMSDLGFDNDDDELFESTNLLNKKKSKGLIVDSNKFNKYIDNYIDKSLDQFKDDFEFEESDFFKIGSKGNYIFIDKNFDYLDDLCQSLNDDWLADAELSSEIMLDKKSIKKLSELFTNIFSLTLIPDLYYVLEENYPDAVVDITTHMDDLCNTLGKKYATEVVRQKWFEDIDEGWDSWDSLDNLNESEIQEIEDMTFITENDEEFEEIIDTDEDYTLEDEDGYDIDMEDEFESLNESVDLTKIKLSSSSNDFNIIEYYAGIIKFKKYKIQIGKCLIGEGVYPFLSVNNEIDIYSDNEYETLLLVDDMTFSDEDIKNYLKEIKIKDSDLEEVVNEIVDNFDEYLKKIFKQCKKYQ